MILKYGNFRTRPGGFGHEAFLPKKRQNIHVIPYFFSTVSERFDVTKYGLVWFRPGCVGTPPIKYYNHRFTVFYVQFYSKNQKKI